MKVSLSWLQRHIDLADTSVDKLRDLLTFAGIEVEGVEVRGIDSDKIVVAQVLESAQHPNADRLSVAKVDDGSGTPRQIVCGAKNYKAGDKVPLALPGAVLPGGMEIKAGKLRDVESNGMMCSGRELGIGDDHAGLLILDPSLPVGKPFREVVPPDVMFDLEITPNRPDLLSHRGLARELAALTGKTLKHAEHALPPEKKAGKSQVRLDAPESCPLYTARIIRGVKVGSSPEWLQRRLQSVGLRPINNVVDITNYVLMELGQPLHAFDLDKLHGGIVVRQAGENETITTLDDQSHTLAADDLVIADKATALAIAGVMGGSGSGVTEETKDILIESAYFTPSKIRRTARKLGLSSDSSYRFERGVDPQGVYAASALATKLILEVAGGAAEEDVAVAGKAPKLTGEVVFDEVRARSLIGVPELDRFEMHKVLTSLGLQFLGGKGRDSSKWSIPSYRLDLQRSVDLVEEVARVIGLERVPAEARGVFTPSSTADRAYDFAMSVRQALTNRGVNEAQTLRLISATQLGDVLGAKVAPDKAVAVKNPLSEDHTTLRPSLIPGMIGTAALNIRQGLHRLRFFEIGRVFLMNPNGTSREEERLALLVSGPLETSSWHANESAAADLFALRGIIESLPGISGQFLELVPKPLDGWLLSAEVKRGSKTLGWVAQVHPARSRQLDARHPIYVAELSMSAVQQGAQASAKFTELQRFPTMTRDVALEVPVDLPSAKIAAFFASQKDPLFVGAEVFDVFSDATGKKLPADKKSTAWTLTYRHSERTLSASEVDEAHQRILKALLGTLPATIR
jgi:phenylalanyl-tRNA synthetase beta chain